MELEFSRILDANVLLQGPQSFFLSASKAELEAVCKRLGLIALDALTADITVHPPTQAQKSIQLDVVLAADLVQTCVVSLKPVPEKVSERISLLLSKDPEPEAYTADDHWLDLAREEAETLYVGGTGLFDMGEIMVQYLSLSMNPYPRHEDAVFEPIMEELPEKNPFAKLNPLRGEDEG